MNGIAHGCPLRSLVGGEEKETSGIFAEPMTWDAKDSRGCNRSFPAPYAHFLTECYGVMTA